MARLLLTMAVLAAGLGACRPATVTPPPLPDVPIVHVSPAAVPFAIALGAEYQAELSALPFDLIPIGSQAGEQAVAEDDASLMIDFPPVHEGWFVTPLGWEAIAVIVNRQVAVRALTIEDLQAAFSGKITRWSGVGGPNQAIQIIIPPDGDRLRQQFLDQVLPGGRVTTNALLAPTPNDALDLVAESPGALAIVPFHALPDERVATVRVEGTLPSPSTTNSGSYRLRTPLLASAPEQPGAAIRDWLVWVQSRGLPSAAPTATDASPSTSEPN